MMTRTPLIPALALLALAIAPPDRLPAQRPDSVGAQSVGTQESSTGGQSSAVWENSGRQRYGIFAGCGRTPLSSGQPSGSLDPTASTNGPMTQNRNDLLLGNPFGIEVRGDRYWITTIDDHCVYHGQLDHPMISRVAGTGQQGYSGDDGPALDATFNWPHEVRSDPAGNLYIADTRNHVIRRIDSESGIITTIAGDGTEGFAGDGESGDRVRFRQPHSVVLDDAGGLIVADTVNHRLRRIDLTSGIVQTIAGNGQKQLPTDGAKASESPLFGPRSLAVDDKSIWVALREGNSIWRIDRATGAIHHVAGTGKKGYSGDGGSPKTATFSGPKGLDIDDRGRLLVVDTENHAVRRIDLRTDQIETVLGGKAAKTTTPLKRPHGIRVLDGAKFLVADSEQHRVVASNDAANADR
ncbi:NHL repeat protein [Rubripirellula lacrimiformis]|uniref:NHL repeat protein n=1 Tax=Rubripirellula lacrimiformis TaxID=1930273 RepID=A0A517NB96_9BACT|nr:hypothetical protein [Rubripirellula lacrimiformis]QDT04401.1 NHL repeat protein [Rubripirellula lacrimiformis]